MRTSYSKNLPKRAFFVEVCFLLAGCAALPSASNSSPLAPSSAPASGRTWQDRIMNAYVADGSDSQGLAYFKSDTPVSSSSGAVYNVCVAVGTCTLASVTVPDTWNGNPVVGIKEQGFAGDTALTGITLPSASTFTWIGSEAFADTSLSSLTIPDYVTQLNPSVFLNCVDLHYVYFSSSNRLTLIDEYAFANCYSLERCRLPENLTTIGASAFQGDYNIIRMILPSTLTTIRTGAFLDCAKMTLAYFPSGVTTVEAYAFKGCYKAQAYFNDTEAVTIAKEVDTGATGFRTNWDYVGVTYTLNTKKKTFLKRTYSKQNIGSSSDYIYVKKNASDSNANYDITIIAYVGSDNSQDAASVNLDDSETGRGAIPRTITDDGGVHNVVAIDQYAFQNHTELGNVVFGSTSAPSLITRIEDHAFEGCDNLTEVNLNNASSLQYIGTNAFYRSSTATANITAPTLFIPASVTTIGANAFSGFNRLRSLVFEDTEDHPSQLAKIYGNAFAYAGNIFYSLSDLTNLPTCDLTIPCNKLTTIANGAFKQAYCLRSVTFRESVTDSSLTAPDIALSDNAFFDTIFVQSVTLSSHVISLGEKTFGQDKIGLSGDGILLHALYLPSTLTTLSKTNSFDRQYRLTLYAQAAEQPAGWVDGFNTADLGLNLQDPKSEYIGYNSIPIFYGVGTGASQRHLIHYTDATNGTFDFLTEAGGTTAVCTRYYFNGSISTSLTPTIPLTVTSDSTTYTVNGVEVNAFYHSVVNSNANSLTKVTLPTSIATLSSVSFMDCTKLTTVVSYSVDNSGQTTLHTNRLPQSLTTMGDYVFMNDPLTIMQIPMTIQEIGKAVFSNTSLTSIALVDEDGTTETNGSVYSVVGNVLYLGTSAGNYTKLLSIATKYNTYGQLTIPSGVTTITQYAFDNARYLTGIQAPASLTNISLGAFLNADYMTSFRFSADGTGLLNIANSAFRTCAVLATVELPSRLISIGDSAFRDDSALAYFPTASGQTSPTAGLLDLSTHADLQYIGSYGFYGCSSITKAVLPDTSNLTELQDNTFKNCTNMATMNLGTHLTSIGANCFDGDTSLSAITIPSSVTEIGAQAFLKNTGLKTITFGDGSATSILNQSGTLTFNKQVFQQCTNASLTKIVIPSNAKFVFDSTNYPFALDTQLTIYLGCTASGYTTANYPTGWNYRANSTTSTALPFRLYSESRPDNTTYSYWHYDSNGAVTNW